MVKTLAQLRKERDQLLKKSQAQELRSRERQIIEKEIRLLKSPGRRTTKLKLGKLVKATGSFIKKRGDIIRANLEEIDRDQNRSSRNTTKSKLRQAPQSKSKLRPKRR